MTNYDAGNGRVGKGPISWADYNRGNSRNRGGLQHSAAGQTLETLPVGLEEEGAPA
jgi:hypothetical protein